LRSGDEEAFISLYQRRQAAIYRFALHMTASPSTAEDVTQEVFLTLLRKDCGYDPARGTVSGYLYGVARKLVLRHLEKHRMVAEHDIEDREWALPELLSDVDPMVDLMRREGIEELRRAVWALPRRYREVVVLCDLEEVDYADAAVVLGCPVGTIRSRLHRARALLLDKLRQKTEPRGKVTGLNPARSLI
jgi:RNA polymerase sigma-70 factor (ECF subfamily)